MGDSPELIPLDSSLFSDLIEKVAWLVIATAHLREEGKPCYSIDTPDNAWATMVAAWELVPNNRIVADIRRFQMALEAILAADADGSYVDDHDIRDGHRRTIRRLVRGGAIQERDDNGAKINLKEGLADIFNSWKGITAKIEQAAV